MRALRYAELLKDRRWQKRRLEIFARDAWECRAPRCPNRGRNEISLAVHHLEYLPGVLPWDHPDNLLLTLCQPCHDRRHRREGEQFAFTFMADLAA